MSIATERVGLDDVSACLAVTGMDCAHDVGPGEHQVLVAALQRGSAKILGSQSRVLQLGAHRAVQHENAFRERLVQEANAIQPCLHTRRAEPGQTREVMNPLCESCVCKTARASVHSPANESLTLRNGLASVTTQTWTGRWRPREQLP